MGDERIVCPKCRTRLITYDEKIYGCECSPDEQRGEDGRVADKDGDKSSGEEK